MSKRPFVIFGIFAAICVVLVPAWALSKEGGEGASPETVAEEFAGGEELFQINCGACHTLAAAGTDGVVGPNLDTRFGLGSADPATIKATETAVLIAIENGMNVRMPAGILQGEQAKQVAEFVGANVNYVSPAAPPPGG